MNLRDEDHLVKELAEDLSMWSHDHRKLNILAIDDDAADLEILRRTLGKITEWEIHFHAFQDPTEAWDHLEKLDLDLALLDFNIGTESGLDVLESIRSALEDLPIIMVTGCGSEEVAVKSLQMGASDYVVKETLSVSSLRRSISNALQKSTLIRSIRSYREHLEKTVDSLTQRNQHILAFYHTVAHELKTPLAAVREFLSLVSDGVAGPITQDQRTYLKLAEESTHQVKQIIHDLLDSARLETGKFSIHRRPESISNTIVQALAGVALTAKLKSLEIEHEIPETLPEVFIDKERIQQVLMNLLTNSIKFTPSGGQIRVEVTRCQKPGNLLEVTVTDTGVGLSEQQIEQVFEPFFQAENTDPRSTDTGLGIGLSISRDLVKLHGGDIWVESELGEGSRFCFTVPIHEGA